MWQLLLSIIYGSIFFLSIWLSSGQQQPKLATCCQDDIKTNHSRLFHCIMEYNQEQKTDYYQSGQQNSFVLYTYATDSILDYSSYSIAINSIYAASRGYSFQFTSPATGHQFYANDERWNKIRILMQAMDLHAKTAIAKRCPNKGILEYQQLRTSSHVAEPPRPPK